MTRLAFGLEHLGPTSAYRGRRAADRRPAIAEDADTFAQRPAVGLPAARRHARPAPDGPPVLRLHRRRHRPLPASTATLRQVMLSARELALDEEPERDGLGQPADRLHPRHRASRWSRSTRSRRRASRTSIISNLPPVSSERRAADHRAPDLLRRAANAATSSSAPSSPSSTTRAAQRRRHGRDVVTTTAGRARPGSSSTRPSTRLLFALRFRDLDLLISDQVTDREPAPVPPLARRPAAADRAVPALRQGPVRRDRRQRPAEVHPGRLHDQRPVPARPGVRPVATCRRDTASATTPFNYIRNSVKIVMDAYDGTMTFYVADAERPAHPGLGRASSRRCSSR